MCNKTKSDKTNKKNKKDKRQIKNTFVVKSVVYNFLVVTDFW